MSNLIKNIVMLVICIILISWLTSAKAADMYRITCTYSNHSFDIHTYTSKSQLDYSVNKDGVQYHYHVDNLNKLNPINDYVELENNRGYKMTYSLKCRKK